MDECIVVLLLVSVFAVAGSKVNNLETQIQTLKDELKMQRIICEQPVAMLQPPRIGE